MSTNQYHTPPQRWIALGYGLLTHATFGLAVAAMAWGLFSGLHQTFGRASGHWAWPANVFLLLQFPAVHSYLLSERGRRWLGRLAPPSLRRELSTTVFALISSLQLLLCFSLWSPLPSFVWTPGRLGFALLTTLYAASWLMLVQAMREAGLGLHLGSLGWCAVWRQNRVEYPALPTGVLHQRSRQPIYLAFSLILWTAPTWTIDRLIFTLGWTAYCVVGAMFKERRYRHLFGEAFAAYQRQVPFWFPRLRRRAKAVRPAPTPDESVDVAVVGGGPVGLLLANLLARDGHAVALVERRVESRRHSMAIGITPPSLDLLADLGLACAFRDAGVPIRRAVVHENKVEIGELGFSGVDGAYRYILSLPQADTERLLETRLRTVSHAMLHYGWEAMDAREDRAGIRLTVRETNGIRTRALVARFVVACDGAHSPLRAMRRMRTRIKQYAPCFTMADYVDTTGLGDEAHLFFGHERPVESFPLPGGFRRWIIRTGWQNESDVCEPFETTIARLTGFSLSPAACVWRSAFRPRRHEVHRFYDGHLVFCGDAAHGMSPIGGQGMNTGFGDAAHLAHALRRILRESADPRRLLTDYSRVRRQAFRRAAARAAFGMWVGTRTGAQASALRGRLVAALLRHPRTHLETARWFTMRSLPQPIRLEQYRHA